MIPYGRQDVRDEDIAAVAAILRSDWLTQGPAVPRFEADLASYCGTAHGVAVNSATSALHLACLAIELGPGDRLWTSPITFVASANCARYCGADVDFVDIDPNTLNLDPSALADKLEKAERDGSLPKAVVPVHFAGQSCDMLVIHDLSRRYGFRIIEDASHAVGGRYQDMPVGNCCYSDVTIFSFHPVKIITTGEGGMALTNEPVLAQRMRRLRSHGIVREAAGLQSESEGSWYYQQLELGFNYRMTDFQAALGSSQLNRLDEYVAARTRLAHRYDSLLNGLPIATPQCVPGIASSWHLYVIRLNDGQRRKAVFEQMRDMGIGVNVHYIPVHTQPYYSDLGFRRGDYPNAERYYDSCISLPMYPGLTDAEQSYVVTALCNALA
jgi:UDP-4-amino-4,6-dideoxy-N-acetyl-beta-L-altrosamine transaminase